MRGKISDVDSHAGIPISHVGGVQTSEFALRDEEEEEDDGDVTYASSYDEEDDIDEDESMITGKLDKTVI